MGVTRASAGLTATGMSIEDLATYDSDNILAAIDKFASPAVTATVAVVQHHTKEYLIIKVQEFGRTPTLCSRDGSWLGDTQKIAAGSIYIRPPGLVETRRPRSGAELEEVIELAAEKRAVQMVKQRDTLNAAISGVAAGASSQPTTPKTEPEQYDKELGDAAQL